MSGNAITMKTGPWTLQCTPRDGARLDALEYDGHPLLTTAPKDFRPPKQDYGEYELRPVYGYDDCFPTDSPCPFPGREGLQVRDHGELCWLAWQVEQTGNQLDCFVRSQALPNVTFRRRMIFSDDSIEWQFEATNEGDEAVPFVHVMHPLMPPEPITSIQLPEFDKARSELRKTDLPVGNAAQCAEHILQQPVGTTDMMVLEGVRTGEISLALKPRLTLTMEFDPKVCPAVGIWWNRTAYPDEDGLRRSECAFEPILGAKVSLADAVAEGVHATIPANGKSSWQSTWRVRSR